mmetsp:Transcript_3086/g.6389  ORF Transcript_3086/g.6389 Transcript_3086/m.6389 type:complete len:341 (-) Transcript_3086:1327-2349(-)
MSDLFSKPIKLQFFHETKRLPSAPKSFVELQTILKDTYNIPNPIVQYMDEDGDRITVSTQPEYEDALMLGGDKIVKLNVLTMNSLRYPKQSALDNFESICTVPMTISRMSGAVPSLRESFVPELFKQERSEVDSDFQSLLKESKLVSSSSDSEEYSIEEQIKEADKELEESKELQEPKALDKNIETDAIGYFEVETGSTRESSFAQTEVETFSQEVQTKEWSIYTEISDSLTSLLARIVNGQPYPEYEHPGKWCTSCDSPVFGACFTCSECPNHFLCENCFMKTQHPHLFIKVKPPQMLQELEEQQKRRQPLSQSELKPSFLDPKKDMQRSQLPRKSIDF